MENLSSSSLYKKLEECKEYHQLRKSDYKEKLRKILSSIVLEKEIVLKTYYAKENREYPLFQRNIDLNSLRSKFNEDYEILYDENDKHFNIVKDQFSLSNNIFYFINMYIFIPKKVEEECFCLLIKRHAFEISFEFTENSNEEIGKFYPHLYCERDILKSICMYNFDRKIDCELQLGSRFNEIEEFIEINSLDYIEVAKEHIISCCLPKEYSFIIAPTSDYIKYIEKGENLCYLEILTKIYKELKNSNVESKEMTISIGKYVIKVKANKAIKKKRASVIDDTRGKNKHFGIINIDIDIVSAIVEIYENDELAYELKLELCEKTIIKDKLEKYNKGNFCII